MSIYDKGNDWFTGLSGSDRSVVLSLGGNPLPCWVAESLKLSGIRTAPAEIPIGSGYRSAEFMTTMLRDFLTHEAPGTHIMLQALPSAPTPTAA